MKIYNTLTGRKEEFVPINENNVKMYACGITVSGEAHIGHAYQAMIYDIIRKYLEKSNTEKVTFEYLLLKDVNDTDIDVFELAKVARKIPCKINLIVYNNWDGSVLKGSSIDVANKFVKAMLRQGIRTTIRKSKGIDIFAACGQLKTKASKGNTSC